MDVEDRHGAQILKKNTKHFIIEELYRTGRQTTNPQELMAAILEIGHTQELMTLKFGASARKEFAPRQGATQTQGSGSQQKVAAPKPVYANQRPASGRPVPMDIDAAKRQEGKKLTCFNCGKEGHFA